MENLVIALAALLVAVVAAVLLLLLRKRKAAPRDAVLLAGITNSGKTSVFLQLAGAASFGTIPSLEPNEAVVSVSAVDSPTQPRSTTTADEASEAEAEHGDGATPAPAASTRDGPTTTIIDVPGLQRLRATVVTQMKPRARAIIFVVDSVNLKMEISDVAEYLYELLADPALQDTPFLIACNKQDIVIAKRKRNVMSALEKELDKVRSSKGASLEGAGSDDTTKSVTLGDESKPLKFEHLRQRIDFEEIIACPAKDSEEKVNVVPVRKWIASVLNA